MERLWLSASVILEVHCGRRGRSPGSVSAAEACCELPVSPHDPAVAGTEMAARPGEGCGWAWGSLAVFLPVPFLLQQGRLPRCCLQRDCVTCSAGGPAEEFQEEDGKASELPDEAEEHVSSHVDR